MSGKHEAYKNALKGKKIPVLTLDHKWHKLFTQVEPDRELERLETQLNNLLKRQGKVNTETKSIRALKKKLMDGIVELMDSGDAASQKKIDENRRLIEECNEKMDSYQDEMLELPKEIDECNYALMLRTMEICYQVLQNNSREIENISEWIDKIRVELKKNVVRKQEKELKNQQMYTYMHDIFGADVIEMFDMKYNPMERPLKREQP